MEHTEYTRATATEGRGGFRKDAIAAIRELEPLQAEVEQPSNPAHKGPWQLWHASDTFVLCGCIHSAMRRTSRPLLQVAPPLTAKLTLNDN
jgi:hypothetical protein